MQTPTDQVHLVSMLPGESAMEGFLDAFPRLGGPALAEIGPDAQEDPTGAFGAAYVASVARGERQGPAVERAIRHAQRWIAKDIKTFNALPPAERWRQVVSQDLPKEEIPLLNDNRGLAIYGEAAARARAASPTFKLLARRTADGGFRIGRRQIGRLSRELRAAGCYARVHGPATAFAGYGAERAAGRPERMTHEERAAYAFGAWALKRETYKPELESIFSKVFAAVERLGNALRGRGIQRPEDIFERAWQGRMAERYGKQAARQADAALAGLSANRGRVLPRVAEALGRTVDTVMPGSTQPAAAYSVGDLNDAVRASVLRRDAAAAAAAHPMAAAAPPERRIGIMEGLTSLNVVAALSALADRRPPPFPISVGEGDALAAEVGLYRGFREEVSADQQAAAGAVAALTAAPARPREARAATVARYALPGDRERSDRTNRVPPAVMRESAERAMALMRDEWTTPSFSLGFSGHQPVLLAATLYEALEKALPHLDANSARASGIARSALRHWHENTPEALPAGGHSLQQDMKAAAQAAREAGRTDLPPTLNADIEVTARAVDGLIPMYDALANIANGGPADESREMAEAALGLAGEAGRRVESQMDQARRQIAGAIAAGDLPGFSLEPIDDPDPGPKLQPAPGAKFSAGLQRQSETWESMAGPVEDAAARLEGTGWQASKSALPTGMGEFETPTLVRPGCDIIVHPDLAGTGRGETVLWRLAQASSGRSLVRQHENLASGPVAVRFYDPTVAASAAAEISDKLPFSDPELATRSHSERAQLLSRVSEIVAPYQREDREAWRTREEAAFSAADATVRGFNVEKVAYTYVENPADPTLNPGDEGLLVIEDEQAAMQQWGEDYVPVYTRTGDLADLTVNPQEWPEKAIGALREFYDSNKEILDDNLANYLSDTGEEDQDSIQREIENFNFEAFTDLAYRGELYMASSYSSSDIHEILAQQLYGAGFDAMRLRAEGYGEETYTYISSPLDVELAWDRLESRIDEARAEAEASEERRREWYAQHSQAEIAEAQETAQREAIHFDISRLSAEGFDIDRAAFVSVGNARLPMLEAAPAGSAIALAVHESRAGAAGEGRDVAPVYLRNLFRNRADLAGANIDDAVRLALGEIYASPETSGWLREFGTGFEGDFVDAVRSGKWAEMAPGQANTLMHHVAEGLLARGFDQIRLIGPDGRVQVMLGDATDAVIARDALYRTRLDGRTASDVVGNPTLSAAQRAARLVGTQMASALAAGRTGLLTHDDGMPWLAASRSDEIRAIAGENTVVFFGGPDGFTASDDDAENAAGAASLRAAFSDIETPDGRRTREMQIPRAEMAAALGALAEAGIPAAVADVAPDGTLEITTQAAGAEPETTPYHLAALSAAREAAAREAIQASASADAWIATPLAERAGTVRGLVRRGEIIALRDGEALMFEGPSAERALAASPTLAAQGERADGAVRIAQERAGRIAAELGDARMALWLADGPNRADWQQQEASGAGAPPPPRAAAPAAATQTPARPQAPLGSADRDADLKRSIERHDALAAAHGEAARLVALEEGGRLWLYGDQARRATDVLPGDAVLNITEGSLADGTAVLAASVGAEQGAALAERLGERGLRLAVGDGAGPVSDIAPGGIASIPVMITGAMRAELDTRGYSPEDIYQMRPADAHRILSEPAPEAVPEATPGPEAAPRAAEAAPRAAETPASSPGEAIILGASPEATPAPEAAPRAAETAPRPPEASPQNASPQNPPPRQTAGSQGGTSMTYASPSFGPVPATGSVEEEINGVLQRLQALGPGPQPDVIARLLEESRVPAEDDSGTPVSVLNTGLYKDIRAVSDQVYPLANGYVLFADPEDGRFRAYSSASFLEALRQNGRLHGKPGFGHQLADRIADFSGAYLPMMSNLFGEDLDAIRVNVHGIVDKLKPNAGPVVVERLFSAGRTVMNSGASTPSRQPTSGLYFKEYGQIAISMDLSRGDPYESAFHEGFHAVSPLLDAKEKAALAAVFGGGDRGAGLERMAEGFGKYAAALYRHEERPTDPRFPKPELPPAAAAASNKLFDLLQKVNNVLTGRGWRTFQDISANRTIKDITEGRVAARAVVFDVDQKITVDEALKIAEATDSRGLAQTLRGFGTHLDLRKKAEKVIDCDKLYEGLIDGGLKDREIRKLLVDVGYQEIVDAGGRTGLLRDVEQEKAALIAQATSMTPEHVENSGQAFAHLGNNSRGGGSTASTASAAAEAARSAPEAWELDQDAFIKAARVLETDPAGKPVKIGFPGVAGQPALASAIDSFERNSRASGAGIRRWSSYEDPKMPLKISGEEAKDWHTAAKSAHYTLVKQALARPAAFVPDRAVANYPDLAALHMPRIVDDLRLARGAPGEDQTPHAGETIAHLGHSPGAARYSTGAAHSAAARKPEAEWERANDRAPSREGWMPRHIRIASEAGERLPALVRGDFAVVQQPEGRFALMHLGSGAVGSGAAVTDGSGAALERDAAAPLHELAEALQPHATRHAFTPGEFGSALAAGSGDERAAPMREAIAGFAAGGDDWRRPLAAGVRFSTGAARPLAPRNVSGTLPAALADLGTDRAAEPRAAGARAPEIWQLDQDAFIARGRPAEKDGNGNSSKMEFAGVAGAPAISSETGPDGTPEWKQFAHSAFPLNLGRGAHAKDWRAAGRLAHYTQVQDALRRGAAVPDSVREGYSNLAAAFPARAAQASPGEGNAGIRYSLPPDTAESIEHRRKGRAGFDAPALAGQGFDTAAPQWAPVPDPTRPRVQDGGATVFADEAAARRLIGDDIAPVYVRSDRPADLAAEAHDPVLASVVDDFWRANEDVLRRCAADAAQERNGGSAAAIAAAAELSRQDFSGALREGRLGSLVGNADFEVMENVSGTLVDAGYDSVRYRDAGAGTLKQDVPAEADVALAWDRVEDALRDARRAEALRSGRSASAGEIQKAQADLADAPGLDTVMRDRRQSGLTRAYALGGLGDPDPAATGDAIYLAAAQRDRKAIGILRQAPGVEYDAPRQQFWIPADHQNAAALRDHFGQAQPRALQKDGLAYLSVPAAERDAAVAAGARYDRGAGRFHAPADADPGPFTAWRGPAAAAAVQAERQAARDNRGNLNVLTFPARERAREPELAGPAPQPQTSPQPRPGPRLEQAAEAAGKPALTAEALEAKAEELRKGYREDVRAVEMHQVILDRARARKVWPESEEAVAKAGTRQAARRKEAAALGIELEPRRREPGRDRGRDGGRG